MATITLNATFDGVTPVQNIGFTDPWSGSGRINRYDAFVGDPGDDLEFTGSFTGSDWRVRSMGIGSESREGSATLTDLDDGGNRRIERLYSDFDLTVDLLSTRIQLLGAEGDTHNINIGGGRIDFIQIGGNQSTITTSDTTFTQLVEVWQGTADVTVNQGGVRAVNLEDGNDMLVLNGRADHIQTDDGNDTVIVNDTGGFDFMRTGKGRDEVTVDAFGTAVRMGDGADTMTVESNGEMKFFDGDAGNDHLIINGGRIDAAEMDRGNDSVTMDGGRIGSLTTGSDNTETIVMRGGSRINNLNDWENGTLNLTMSGTDTWIGNMDVTGDANIELSDGARFNIAKFEFGTVNLTTGDRFTDTVTGYEMTLNATFNDGIGQIRTFNETATTHRIVTNEFVGQIHIDDRFNDETDNTATHLTLNGYTSQVTLANGDDTVNTGDTDFVEFIYTNKGNDRVNLGEGGTGTVKTGRGDDRVVMSDRWVELVTTGDGKDRVDVGTEGGGQVRLGDDNDTARLSVLEGEFTGVMINGGGGTDLIDFRAYQVGVTFNLDLAGQYQQITGGDGYVAELSVENLTGSNEGDSFSGDRNDNKFSGRGGDDTLMGGEGDDTLIGSNGKDSLSGGLGDDSLSGGKSADRLKGSGGEDTLNGGTGNDVMTGGGDADLFVFSRKNGTDRITDFEDGLDLINLRKEPGGFAALTISDDGADLRIEHAQGVIILEGLAGTTLTADDFVFG